MAPVAIPAIIGAAASAGVTTAFGAGLTAAFGGGAWGAFGASVVSGLAGAVASGIASAVLAPKPQAPDLTAQLNNAGAGRTQQIRQPVAPHQQGFGRYKSSGPILHIHTADDDDGRANGFLYLLHGLSGGKIEEIGDVYLGDDLSTASQFDGLVRIKKHLGESDQVADADLVAEIPDVWTTDHRLRGRAYISTRLKWSETAYPGGIPNIAAIVMGNDEIYDPR